MLNSRKKEIRIEADSFRGNCKVGQYGLIDLFKECERCKYKLLRYPIGESADLGFAMRRDTDTIIFTNTSSRLSREIFTLAHEIGHTILHFGDGVSFMDDAVIISEKNADEKEQEANYFAACLLMPVDMVDKFLDLEIIDFEKNRLSAMDIARMMSEFGVSFDMVLNRLESLGKINSDEKLRLDNEKNQIRVGNLLRSVGGNSRLNEPSEEISIPHEYIEYVIYNYNRNAVPLETLKKALKYYQLIEDDVSDRITVRPQDEEELDYLIGGLED